MCHQELRILIFVLLILQLIVATLSYIIDVVYNGVYDLSDDTTKELYRATFLFATLMAF